MTSVLLADDQELVRSGFRLILELSGFEIAGEAGNGAEAVAMAKRLRPDVVLMDIRMPELDGIAATRQIVSAGLDTRVLVLTTFNLDEYVYDALRAGASGFLLKDVGRQDLVDAVRTVAEGESLFAAEALCRLVTHYATRPRMPFTPPPGHEELTISLPTVKTHVRHVLAKLGLRDRVQAVVLAYESGLVQAGAYSSIDS